MPAVLVELRDTGGADVTVATEWASRHGLNCPTVINYASLLRGRWARSSQTAEALSGGRITLVGTYRPPSEAERPGLPNAQNNPWSLPRPDMETLSEWRRRATDQYRELESVIYLHGRPRQSPTGRRIRSVQPWPWLWAETISPS